MVDSIESVKDITLIYYRKGDKSELRLSIKDPFEYSEKIIEGFYYSIRIPLSYVSSNEAGEYKCY